MADCTHGSLSEWKEDVENVHQLFDSDRFGRRVLDQFDDDQLDFMDRLQESNISSRHSVEPWRMSQSHREADLLFRCMGPSGVSFGRDVQHCGRAWLQQRQCSIERLSTLVQYVPIIGALNAGEQWKNFSFAVSIPTEQCHTLTDLHRTGIS